MKNIILSMVFSILLLSLGFAQQGVHEQGTGLEDPALKEANQGTGLGLTDNNTSLSVNAETQQQNSGESIQSQIQVQNQVRNVLTENGQQVQMQLQDKNQLQLKVGNMTAKTAMAMTQEQTQLGTKLKVQLSNGRNAEVKIMPDTASERALERLQLKVCSEENNCSIELKEVGQGEQAKVAYELKVEKQSRVLGLFKTKMQVQAQVNAETGELIQTKKPWWAFLASEQEE